MATIEKCSVCGRKGGYVDEPGDKMCARCKLKKGRKKEVDNKEDVD